MYFGYKSLLAGRSGSGVGTLKYSVFDSTSWQDSFWKMLITVVITLVIRLYPRPLLKPSWENRELIEDRAILISNWITISLWMEQLQTISILQVARIQTLMLLLRTSPNTIERDLFKEAVLHPVTIFKQTYPIWMQLWTLEHSQGQITRIKAMIVIVEIIQQ